jgi:16S rRNA G966 N2-methylase RsmD
MKCNKRSRRFTVGGKLRGKDMERFYINFQSRFPIIYIDPPHSAQSGVRDMKIAVDLLCGVLKGEVKVPQKTNFDFCSERQNCVAPSQPDNRHIWAFMRRLRTEGW